MKVIWIFYRPLNHYLESHNKGDSGASWIESVFKTLHNNSRMKFVICFPLQQEEEVLQENIDGVMYYVVKKESNIRTPRNNIIERYKKIFEEEKPDIIHIWGTEFPQVLCSFEAAEQMNMEDQTVISLQGMCAAIESHYYADIPFHVRYGFSLRDLLKRDNLWIQQKGFRKRAEYEKLVLSKATNVIGRTDYDYAYSVMLNRNINYYKCNESLRGVFYDNEWSYEKCIKHRIMVSQGYYPIKGLHFVIEAISKIVSFYPDIELVVAGPDILRFEQKYGYLKGNGYANYIRRLIKSKGLQERIHFVGNQNEDEMCQRYLESNIFISASSTENESNSLGEAKLLGMPVIASFVGGVTDRIKHKEDGLAYQYDDPTILASYICKYFDNTDLAVGFGKKARENELEIVDLPSNTKTLEHIYDAILAERTIE